MKKIIVTLFAMLPLMGFAMCGSGNSNTQSVAEQTTENEAGPVITLEKALESGLVKIVDNVIISEKMPVVVDCYADWCGPCQQYAPIFHNVASDYAGQALFVKLNTDNYPEICNKYKINAIPCTLFIQAGGALLGQEVGLLPGEQLYTLVTQLVYTSEGQDMGQ